jgi:hypothetical protein
MTARRPFELVRDRRRALDAAALSWLLPWVVDLRGPAGAVALA